MNDKPKTDRFIELDLLRGLAIMSMILGHMLWNLDFYGIAPLDRGVYSALQMIAPNLFFLLVGICVVVGLKKKELKGIAAVNNYYKHLFIRGLKIFCLGMLLTVATMIVLPDKPILFGVLHCIGFSIVLTIPFLKYRNYTILFSLIIILSGSVVSQYVVNKPTIFHLAFGLHQKNIWSYTVDYFPLIPWFGICLLGVVIGDWLYCGDCRRFRFPDLSKYRPVKICSWIGQHSLGIYLLHQPILAGLLMIYLRF